MSQTSKIIHIRKIICGGILLPLILAGCGGSSSSNTATYTGTDMTATISNPTAPLQPKGYSINIAPSGAATYTITSVVGYSQGQLQYST